MLAARACGTEYRLANPARTELTEPPDGMDVVVLRLLGRAACDLHWRYLLTNETRLVFLQCPSCVHRWWHDTEFGVGDTGMGLAS